MLYRSELKKLLLTRRGLLLLILCIGLKVLFLSAFPEQKDPRILLSQKQYDKYLAQLYGEDTPEKSEFILTEYQTFLQIIDQKAEMQALHTAGAITDEQWQEYTKSLEQAELRRNSAKLFAEKAEQFATQPEDLPPAHYIYEYGWQTIFRLQQFPDIFLLFAVLVLSSLCFPAEGDMLPVLLAARDGRGKLFRAKLLALLTLVAADALISGVAEASTFLLRGWCNDSGAPVYSITLLADCPLDLCLRDAYALCLAVRFLSTVLFCALIFALSLWLRNTANLIFLGLCILLLPLMWNSPVVLFFHGGLLCGTRTLQWLGSSGLPVYLPLTAAALSSTAALLLAAGRHRSGI